MSSNEDIKKFLKQNIACGHEANNQDNTLAHAIYALVIIVGEIVLRMPEEK